MDLTASTLSGEWINQNGSTLQLHEQDGVISGSYCSRKGRAASGKEYPIVGMANGDVLAFSVDWRDAEANLESITSFSGRIERNADGIQAIHTIWVLVRRWENREQTQETGVWNAFLTNSDVFQRVE